MNNCEICGQPMPVGEEMFNYHGFSGPCQKPSLPQVKEVSITDADHDNRIPSLIIEWSERAIMYEELGREASKRHEDIISAQQFGLATAFRVCAKDLEGWQLAHQSRSKNGKS